MSATDSREAARALRAGRFHGPARVGGLLELRAYPQESLPPGLHCYDLDVSGSRLTSLPDDLRVENRLILDNCRDLVKLPEGLTVGSLSLRSCVSLERLPEGLSTWFLDMTACPAFFEWPRRGVIQGGRLILRDCARMRRLPDWLRRLSHLDLAGCSSLEEIPEGVEVTGWVDVGGTQLPGLPASLAGAPLRWRGVAVDERVAFRPHLLTAREALESPNAEVRRVMIERMGYARFVFEAQPELVDEDRDPGGLRQLLRIALPDDEALVGLSCRCPSTGRQYFIRVPPATRTCHQAAAWIAGFDDATLYHPEVET